MKLLNRIIIGLASILASLTFATNAMANGDVNNGKKLFTESKCNKCHGSEVFTRKDRKVTSLANLGAQIRMCDTRLDTNWFDEDIHDVAAYLNKQYYKF